MGGFVKACFYANVPSTEIEKIEFYNNDVRILRALGYEVFIAENLSDVLSAGQIDLYYVWWWNRALLPVIAARLRRAPVIVCGVFDYFLPYKTKHDYVSRPAWQRFLMRSALARADANVFICNHELELVTRLLGVRDPRMIYLAIDGARYPCKVSAPTRNRLLNIAWSGEENARRKGLFELISSMPEILRAHPDTKLVMAGRRGGSLPALKDLARRLGVYESIEFAGEISFSAKVEEMQRASLYLQPSMYEGFGSAVAEAMACGTPAACTLTGSLPEVMGPSGVPILGAGPSSIAQAVIAFQNLSAEEQLRRGVEAAAFVRSAFSYESRFRGISDLVAEVMRRFRST